MVMVFNVALNECDVVAESLRPISSRIMPHDVAETTR